MDKEPRRLVDGGEVSGGIDMRRLPHEIRRAMAANYEMPELVDPGVSLGHDDDGRTLVVCERSSGRELCRVPFYRIEGVDPALLRAYLTSERFTVAQSDQALAALAEGRLIDDPSRDWLFLQWGDPGCVGFHRSFAVADWPLDDMDDEPDWPDDDGPILYR